MELFSRSVAAAIAAVFFFGHSAPSSAQQAALTANPALAAKGEWDAGTTYAKDDIVTARGSAWISLHAGNLNKVPGQTQPSSAAWWELFARGFNPAGTWSNATKYQPDDLVTQNGQTYRAKLTNQNKQPNNVTYWELFAAKGDPGPNTGVAEGTQSTPAISFSHDADTGIFSPSHGKIAMVEDGNLFLHNLGSGNTALGLSALSSANSGNGAFNTALGISALTANTNGINNTALGPFALADNTAGGFNVAVGTSALAANIGGSNNVAVGVAALAANGADDNTAVGTNALANNTGGTNNVAVGSSALADNTTGSQNTAVGQSTMFANTTGTLNTAIGQGALGSNTTGSQNNAFGQFALSANTTGSQNIAIGQLALSANTTANGNLALGNSALASNTTGSDNFALGSNALGSNTTGLINTAVGPSALAANIDGVGNIALGQSSGNTPAHASNSIFIGNGGQSGDTEVIRIGTTNAQFKTFIAAIRGITTDNNDAVAVMVDSNGQLGTVSSSRRYKYDIETMADVSAMLAKLRPVTFHYKQAQNEAMHPLQYGLIAEEVADVFPDLAVFKDGAPETVKYHLLPTFLLAGWQAQQKTIAALRDEVHQQKEANASLEARLARLEAAMPQTRAAALH